MEVSKYKIILSNNLIYNQLEQLQNKIFKLLPQREEGVDWVSPLNGITEELTGLIKLSAEELLPHLFLLLCKLEGLEGSDFFTFRKAILDSLNLISKIKEDVLCL